MLGREAGKIRSERHSQRRKRFDPLSDDLCGIDGMGQAERLVRVQNRSRKITDDSGLFASIEKQPQGIPENQALPMRTGLGLPRSVCREPCAGGMLGVHCAESGMEKTTEPSNRASLCWRRNERSENFPKTYCTDPTHCYSPRSRSPRWVDSGTVVAADNQTDEGRD